MRDEEGRTEQIGSAPPSGSLPDSSLIPHPSSLPQWALYALLAAILVAFGLYAWSAVQRSQRVNAEQDRATRALDLRLTRIEELAGEARSNRVVMEEMSRDVRAIRQKVGAK